METTETTYADIFEGDGSDLFIDAPDDTQQTDPQDPDPQPEPAQDDGGDDTSTQDPAPTTDPTNDDPEGSPAASSIAAQPETIRVKVRGQDVDVPVKEALDPEYVRKGRAFDDVYQELQQLREEHQGIQRDVGELDYWAKQNNMSRSEYVAFLRSSRRTQAIESESQAIKAKYPDMPDEAVKELAAAKIKDLDIEDAKAEQERAAAEQERQAQEEEARIAPWRDFLRLYPHLNEESKIPADVMADIQAGMRPVEAMQKHEKASLQAEIDKLNQKISAMEKNQQNRNTALPSATNTAKQEPADAFLEGLDM